MPFLAQFYDPALDVRQDDTVESVVREECERLNRMLTICIVASTLSRRLGIDADDAELSLDKRRAKRLAHALQQCLTAWQGSSPKKIKDLNLPGNDRIKKEAAQMKWDEWWADHSVWLQNRIRYVATWSSNAGVDKRWAKSAIVRLQNEANWVPYALR